MAHASKIQPSIWAVFYWLTLLIPADYPLVVMLPLLKEYEKFVGILVRAIRQRCNKSPGASEKCRQPKSVVLFMVLRNKFDAIARVELIYVRLTIVS